MEDGVSRVWDRYSDKGLRTSLFPVSKDDRTFHPALRQSSVSALGPALVAARAGHHRRPRDVVRGRVHRQGGAAGPPGPSG